MLKNIDATKEIAAMTRTSMGPNGMNKYIINHIDKLFLTKDTATMCKELDINHPAARLVVQASKLQEAEQGDNTNFVITFAGEALNQAASLIKSGLHQSDILIGYEKAFKKCTELLDNAPKYTLGDVRNVEEVTKIIKPIIGSKMMLSQENILAPLIANACINVMPSKSTDFNVENVRCAKILGGSLIDSQVIKGLVVIRNVEGSVTKVENCKVAVFNCPLECTGAETKDTVVFKSANELLNYTKLEEDHMERIMKEIVDSGVKAVIVGGSIDDMAVHFADKYGIILFRIMSKFELKRIAKALGASLLVRLGAPTKEEMGHADKIYLDEISSQKCIVLVRNSDENKLSTIVLRGSTTNMLDNIERIIEDGVNTFKSACKDHSFVPGAGAIEMYLANGIKEFSKTVTSLDQYAIAKFGEAFEVVPRTLSENSGLNVNEVIANLVKLNHENAHNGINIKVCFILILDWRNSKCF
jgi:T-complex protein 1 subunit theta